MELQVLSCQSKILNEALFFLILGLLTNDRFLLYFQELKESLDGKNERLYPMQVNLCHEEEIQRVFQWAEETIGGIDVLVNNAGVSGQKSLLGKWNTSSGVAPCSIE